MYHVLKRIIDIVVSLVSVIILAPLFAVISLAIKLDSRGPVFFKQKRFGKNKIYFNILKFRTMRDDAPKDMPTHLFSNSSEYLTKVGRFLRKTSLDELPQLINILAGQMSIVGPRPALWNQQDLIDERDKYGANDITPGLTGWAQVAKLDGEYVNNISFLFDIKCFFKTFSVVLTAKGVKEGSKDDSK